MAKTSSGNLAQVLLVDDNEDDALIARKGFESANLPVHLHHVENGRDCMAFLLKKAPFSDAPTPDLILLDLNMPVMDGREVLTEIVKHEELRKLPVIVLTTSATDRDLLTMYELRCSSYIKKPVDFQKFEQVIHTIGNYWFKVVMLPPGNGVRTEGG